MREYGGENQKDAILCNRFLQRICGSVCGMPGERRDVWRLSVAGDSLCRRLCARSGGIFSYGRKA